MTFAYIYEENEETIARTNEDGTISYIPKDEANPDYQVYLASLDEQQAAQQLGGNPIGLD